MKYNLKNRPILNEELPMTTRLKDYWYKSQDWFEGFEAELRDIEKDTYTMNTKRLAWLIKEILGE